MVIRGRGWIAAALVLLEAASTQALCEGLTVRKASEGCTWVDLEDPRPLWAPWMVWSESGSSLLVPDPLSGEIFAYGADGALERRLRRPGQGPLEYLHPGRMVAAGDGFLLEEAGPRLIRLNGEGEPVASLDLSTRAFPGEQRVVALFDWTVAGGWVYSFGHLRGNDGTWWSGWFRFSHQGEPRLERIREVATDDAEHLYYTLGFNYATAVRERAYLLMMEPEPYILEVDGDRRRRLTATPDGFDRRPELPPAGGLGDQVPLFAAVERAAMPVGLYGAGGRLFVLARRPTSDGRTVWKLTGIDPAADRVVSRVKLPTSTAHLVGAPGPDRWAFLEKGPVSGVGEQEVETLLFMPTGWLLEGSSDPCGRSRGSWGTPR